MINRSVIDLVVGKRARFSCSYTRCIARWICGASLPSAVYDNRVRRSAVYRNNTSGKARFFLEIISTRVGSKWRRTRTRARSPSLSFSRSRTLEPTSVDHRRGRASRLFSCENNVDRGTTCATGPTCLLRGRVVQMQSAARVLARVHLDVCHPRRSRRWSLASATSSAIPPPRLLFEVLRTPVKLVSKHYLRCDAARALRRRRKPARLLARVNTSRTKLFNQRRTSTPRNNSKRAALRTRLN